ncbi:hypothetical protein FB451DRAFT_1320347 [Mycena latifolia]|nr:hypothetical protein FB451DRAFT_1320347 [Mycena latifolia]
MRSVLGKTNCSVHSPSSARGGGYVFLTTAVSSDGTSSSPQDASAVVPASSPLQNTQNDWTRGLPDFSTVPSHVPLTSSAYSPVAPRATFHLSPRRPCRRLCLCQLYFRPSRLRPPLHPQPQSAPSAAAPFAAPRAWRATSGSTVLPHPRHCPHRRLLGVMPLNLLLPTTLLWIAAGAR